MALFTLYWQCHALVINLMLMLFVLWTKIQCLIHHNFKRTNAYEKINLHERKPRLQGCAEWGLSSSRGSGSAWAWETWAGAGAWTGGLALQGGWQGKVNGKINLPGNVRKILSSCHECHGIWGDNGTNDPKNSIVFLRSFSCVRLHKISGPEPLRKWHQSPTLFIKFAGVRFLFPLFNCL